MATRKEQDERGTTITRWGRGSYTGRAFIRRRPRDGHDGEDSLSISGRTRQEVSRKLKEWMHERED